ncbi:MAG: 4-hydroxy-tetrahydrodipicolinate reductase [Spirochaetaceae bacterium]|nr:MAG: 4-hydroxy-tetrahydrodipicolinate reductase [Spirochaetaceae bacterium]
MKILIVGYGRMGREVERVLAERGHEVAGRIDPRAPESDSPDLEGFDGTADAVIEFATADAVAGNAQFYTGHGIPAVVGTTGWEADREQVRKIVTDGHGSYLWGANFSVGANLFFAMVQEAGRIMNAFDSYDAMLCETHHRGKADSPSGTALEAAKRLLAVLERKRSIIHDLPGRPLQDDELHVASLRGGSVPGTHTVSFDSPFDSISVTHTARTRSGFALGSVLAAEWLPGNRGFLSVDDFFAAMQTGA